MQMSPIHNQFLQGCGCLDPATEQQKITLLDMAISHLYQCKWLSGEEGDDVRRQYLQLCGNPIAIDALRQYRNN